MPWHIKYRTGTAEDAIDRHPTAESAIEAACRLIHSGRHVYEIGMAALDHSVGPREIAKLYNMWVRVLPSPENADVVQQRFTTLAK